MGERKVINKYYPPDFDPSKIARKQIPNNQQVNVRTMLSMTIRCATCHNYIYTGSKVNARKEKVMGETYHGIPIYRFYFKCKCSCEIIFKTDPKNDGYVVEAGATAARNINIESRHAEEINDRMEVLERRAVDANRERDIDRTLDELKCMKSRREHVSVDAMLEASKRSAVVKQEETLEEEDEVVIKSIFGRSKEVLRRIRDEDIEDGIVKKRKVSRDGFGKPTDYLTNNVSESKTGEETGGRVVLKCSTVKFSVVKKPS